MVQVCGTKQRLPKGVALIIVIFQLVGGFVAGGLGFEPRLAESESAVLPLDDPPTKGLKLSRFFGSYNGLQRRLQRSRSVFDPATAAFSSRPNRRQPRTDL